MKAYIYAKGFTQKDVVVQHAKPPLAMPALHTGVLVRVAAALLLIWLYAHEAGKAVDDVAQVLEPDIYVEDPGGAPVSWTCLGLALAVNVSGESNQ